MVAKSLDVVVLLKLAAGGGSKTYSTLATELGMSASEVHAAVHRSDTAGLVDAVTRRIIRKALEEYLIYGVRYAFPATRGAITRGMPTSVGAPPLSQRFDGGNELRPVWPDPEGDTKGFSLEPLFRSVPHASRADFKLYELLVLVDAIRDGRARERNFAESELRKRLYHAGNS